MNLNAPLRLMQKSHLISKQIEMPIANWLKEGYKDIVLFLAIGKLDIFLCINPMKSFKFNISTTSEQKFKKKISAVHLETMLFLCKSILKVMNLLTLSL